ncbi:ATP-grasp domain-containing protein [Methylophaga sp. OBS4]|uniref:ATP-grasp domain-containing protein n=1 Tax=Methylophaga sp. OBS4 TaxID=2991935 RepID=UPI0022584EEC|nr:ATP-grasp domain-containing protein [Methylophaga sp. OBS4]MCX4187004.1 ATP-grasp domain-containing protein [Methylophaga sp. OBS4]
MPQSLPFVFVTHVVNAAVVDGFIPAARMLGYEIILLTDHGKAHSALLGRRVSVIECDVFNPLAILDALTEKGVSPAAIFSNSDHLQTATAIAAAALNLPGKNWQICYAAKEKLRMRRRLQQLDLPSTWSKQLLPGGKIEADWPYPLVVKPSQGVASMDVSRVDDAAALLQLVKRSAQQESLLLESFIEGPLFTLETLGDGQDVTAIGGFDVELSEPPYFIEKQARWPGKQAQQWQTEALDQIRRFGVGFGVCHSEFIATDNGPVLVEINYRSIGDGREFLLDRLLPQGWFTPILKLHLGQPLSQIQTSAEQALIHYLVAERPGILKQAPTVPELAGVSFQPLKQAGESINLTYSNKDYLGVLYLRAEDDAALSNLTRQTLAQLAWEIA